MGFRNFACTLVLTFSFAGTAFGADAAAVPQTLSADMVTAASNEAVPLTGSKVITDEFSFEVPERWAGECVIIQNDDGLDMYDKESYEADGSGLMFSIVRCSDDSYTSLESYSILGFCGSDTFILDTSESENDNKSLKKGLRELQISFVAVVGEGQ